MESEIESGSGRTDVKQSSRKYTQFAYCAWLAIRLSFLQEASWQPFADRCPSWEWPVVVNASKHVWKMDLQMPSCGVHKVRSHPEISFAGGMSVGVIWKVCFSHRPIQNMKSRPQTKKMFKATHRTRNKRVCENFDQKHNKQTRQSIGELEHNLPVQSFEHLLIFDVSLYLISRN